MASLISVLIVAAIAFAATAAVVPAVRRLAALTGLYERPVADRWHRHPVPKLGGVAMAVVFLPIAWFLANTLPLGEAGGGPLGDHRDHVRALVMAAGALFAVGVIDDMWPLRAITKLLWQVAAGLFFIWMSGAADLTGIAPIDVALSLLWFVGITNAFNLLDNIDGLSAGIAGIAAGFVATALLVDGAPSLGVIATMLGALLGVTTGFLLYNWHPASIFMGDGGSHLLGATLAGATLLAATHLGDGTTPGTPMAIVLLLVPCADTLLVTLTRQMAGRSAFIGGRDHLSHRIVALGMPDARAVLILYAVAIAGGFAALGLQILSPIVGWMLVAAYGVLVAGCGVYLAHVETTGNVASPLPGEVATRSRAYELLFDATLIALAYYVGLVTRFQDPQQLTAFLEHLSSILPLVLALHLFGLWVAGRYRRPSLAPASSDLLMILKGAAIGSAASVVSVLYLTGFQGYSRQTFAVAAVLVVLLLAGGHAALNALDEYLRRRRKPAGPQAVIYGSGARSALAVRELIANSGLGLHPVGFIVDDPGRTADRVDGLRVLGGVDDLPAILQQAGGEITTIIVSTDVASSAKLARLCAIAAEHNVEVRQLRLELDEVDTRTNRRGRLVKFP